MPPVPITPIAQRYVVRGPTFGASRARAAPRARRCYLWKNGKPPGLAR